MRSYAQNECIATHTGARLEAAARPGELVIDAATFEALPTSLRASYSAEERIRGKRSEEFRAHRCVMNHDVSPKLLSSAVSSPKEAPGSRRSILELFEKLSPNDLERLIFLLEMPIKEQPSRELTSHERENRILQYFTSEQNGLAKLESELKYLIEKQGA